MSPGWCQLSVMTVAFMPLEDVPTANLVETQPQSLTSSLIISSYHMQLQWRDIAKSIRFGLVHTSHDSVIQHITMINICFLLCSLYSGRSERQNWHSFGFRLVRALYTLSKWRSCGPESQGFPPWMVTMQPIPIEKSLSDRLISFSVCRFLHPLTYGYYPKSIREIVKDRLPKFTADQVKMVKGSYDYVGVNQYTSYYMKDNGVTNPKPVSYQDDWHVEFKC